MLMAFLGSTIAEFKKTKRKFSMLKIMIPLFIHSIGAIIYGAYIGEIVLSGVFSLVIGLITSFLLLYQKK